MGVNTSNQLYVKVVAPKETRNRRYIIKSFIVYANQEPFLCSDEAFKALWGYPYLQIFRSRL